MPAKLPPNPDGSSEKQIRPVTDRKATAQPDYPRRVSFNEHRDSEADKTETTSAEDDPTSAKKTATPKSSAEV